MKQYLSSSMDSCRYDTIMNPTNAKPYYHHRQFDPACPQQAATELQDNGQHEYESYFFSTNKVIILKSS